MRHTVGLTAALVLVAGSATRVAPGLRAVTQTIANAESGAISGVVRDATSHEPIASAVVFLGNTNGTDANGRQITDASGRYVFTHLGPSPGYFVQASRVGYLAGAFGGEYPGDLGRQIALDLGQWFAKADFVLWKPAAISGVITGADRKPVTGAYVQALARIYLAGRPHLAASGITQTDDRGVYRLAGLLPAEYLVAVVRAESVVPPSSHEGYPVTFFPESADVSTATPFPLTFGDDKPGVDVSLHLTPRATVSGVARTAGQSAAGVRLDLVLPGADDLGGDISITSTTVGADGRFTFPNVPAGRYEIAAAPVSGQLVLVSPLVTALQLPTAAGRAPSGTSAGIAAGPAYARIFSSPTRAQAGFWGRVAITVGADNLTHVEVPLVVPGPFRGHVELASDAQRTAKSSFETLSVVMEPADGDPAVGVRVTKPDRVTSEIRFDGVVPGRYVFRLTGGAWSIKSLRCNGADFTDGPFVQDSGRSCTDAAIAVTDNLGALTGRVVDEAGAPADAVVVCFPSDSHQWIDYGLNPQRIHEVRVRGGQTFRMTGLPGGSYLLIAMPEDRLGLWKTPGFFQQVSPVADRVDLAWGQTASRTLRIRRPR